MNTPVRVEQIPICSQPVTLPLPVERFPLAAAVGGVLALLDLALLAAAIGVLS